MQKNAHTFQMRRQNAAIADRARIVHGSCTDRARIVRGSCADPYWQPWETWGAPLHTFSWKLKHNSMSATAVTAAAGNFLQTRFSGFGGHSRPRPHKHSPEHGLGLCEHHQNNFQKCFFCCVCHGKTPGLCHGNSWENEISYKITCKI